MKRSFPAWRNFPEILAHAISGPPPLLLIQEKGHMACVICKKNFANFTVQAVFRVSDSEGLSPTLAALEKLCQENGYGHIWQGKVDISLQADAALFMDFHLPPTSRKKLEKTIPILLDEELPLQSDSYIVKTYLTRDQGYCAIATVLKKKTLEEWRNCLERHEFSEARITVFPWRLIKGLPAIKSPALMLCLSASGNLLCALNAKGEPLRIRQLPHKVENANIFARQTRLLLADMDFQPQNLLIFGGHDQPDLKKAIIEEYNLPVQILGSDPPLGRAWERVYEDDTARILANCLIPRQLPGIASPPVFRFKFKKTIRKTFSWAVPVALFLALLCGWEIFSVYTSLNRISRADRIKAMLQDHLRKEIDNVPKNASLGRLIAILNSRLAELQSGNINSGGRFISLLEDIHKAAPFEARIGVNRLSYDSKRVRLSGNADSYEEVNSLKNGIEKMEEISAVRIINATANQGTGKTRQKIDFELDLELK